MHASPSRSRALPVTGLLICLCFDIYLSTPRPCLLCPCPHDSRTAPAILEHIAYLYDQQKKPSPKENAYLGRNEDERSVARALASAVRCLCSCVMMRRQSSA